MSLCGILGDSIAVGLAMANPGCSVNARVGINAAHMGSLSGIYQWVAISAGSNPPARLRDMERIRAGLRARRVIWILPRNRRAAAVVRQVAVAHGDRTVEFVSGRDGIHPRSYYALKRIILSYAL